MRRGRLLHAAQAALLVGLAATAVQADTLDDIRQRGTLIWGGDQEGGGPLVYTDENDPSEVRGFEVEIAGLLAAKLGVRAQFAQGLWDKLPEILDRGDVDVVLNGYEWTQNRAARYGTSIPYYIYELQMLARKDDDSLQTPDDLKTPRDGVKRRVAVLGGSAAQYYLEATFGTAIDIVSYDGVTDALRAVELSTDGLDATIQDLPVVIFYEKGFPALRRVGEPAAPGYYVALTRKDDTRLLAALNTAIAELLGDGSLRAVYERYGIWNATQARRGLETAAGGGFVGGGEANLGAQTDANATYTPEQGLGVVLQRGPLMLQAAGMTVLLSVVSMPLAVLAGLLVALGRMYGPRLLSGVCATYVELVRGTPLVLQLYVIFFLLPEIGIRIHAFWAAVLGLAMNYSAYEAEIYRAGLQAVPRGQTEAAVALGMSRSLTLRRIIVPQATRIVIPPVTNDFINLFKDTAVCSVITVVELSKSYYIHARGTGAIVELGLLTAILYLAMSYPLSLVAGRLEKRLAKEAHA